MSEHRFEASGYRAGGPTGLYNAAKRSATATSEYGAAAEVAVSRAGAMAENGAAAEVTAGIAGAMAENGAAAEVAANRAGAMAEYSAAAEVAAGVAGVMPKHTKYDSAEGAASQASAMPEHRSRRRQDVEYYPWIASGLASLLLLVMFVEWIRPLIQLSAVTGIYTIEPFVLAVFSFMALDYLRIHPLLVWPLKLIAAWMVIGLFFYEGPLYDLSWWEQYSAVTVRDLDMLWNGKSAALSGENRTLLLLTGLSMMVYSLHYIVVRRHLCGWFIACTIAYLAGLQLAFGLDTTRGIIVSLAAGFMLAALMQPIRWKSHDAAYGVHGDENRSNLVRGGVERRAALGSMTGVFGSFMIIGLALLAGYWTAAEQPRLSQRIDWNVHDFVREVTVLTRGVLPVAAEHNGIPGFATTGYALDEYPLGGSVIPANTAVFTAVSDELSYWRGETKAAYNGAGWSDGEIGGAAADAHDHALGAAQSDRLSLAGQFDKDALAIMRQLYTPIVQKVAMDGAAAMFLDNTLFSGGEIMRVEALGSYQDRMLSTAEHALQVDRATSRYSIATGETIVSYHVSVIPVPNDSLTPQTIDAAYAAAQEHALHVELYEDEKAVYLQLPDGMGERVRELAGQLAADAPNELAIARNISAYLRANYAYDMNESQIPAEGEDFVEHFLFEQRFGYCDHFSTAMAVLLRMNDIPSRWVKGFAPGNISIRDDGKVLSDVRALHAHSWVEAYIPELGWVAFEPTPSYAGSLLPVSAAPFTEQAAATDSGGGAWWQGAATMVLSDGGMSIKNAIGEEMEQMNDHERGRIADTLAGWRDRWEAAGVTEAVLWAIGAALLFVLLITIGRKVRLYLRVWRLERRLRMMERRGGTTILLEQIWNDVFRKHGPIQHGQTLREYVLKLNLRKQEQQKALVELAVLYETLRYDNHLPERLSRGRMSWLWREALG